LSRPTNELVKLVDAAARRITGMRFCRSCNTMRKAEEGGQWYLAGKGKREQRYWRCGICHELRKQLKAGK